MEREWPVVVMENWWVEGTREGTWKETQNWEKKMAGVVPTRRARSTSPSGAKSSWIINSNLAGNEYANNYYVYIYTVLVHK